MRTMNMPGFPGERISIEIAAPILRTRLSAREIHYLDHSLRLIAYMTWPNDENMRNVWMASQIAMYGESHEMIEFPVKADEAGFPLAAQKISKEYFERFGVLPLAQYASKGLHEEIKATAERDWQLVANTFLQHYNMFHEFGSGVSGASLGKVSYLVSKTFNDRGASETKVNIAWRRLKDVAHLITATVLLAHEAITRNKDESWDIPAKRMHPYHIALMVPEVILAVAMEYQAYGLEAIPHSREETLLSPETIWRIPDEINIAPLAPPVTPMTSAQKALLKKRQVRPSPTRSGPALE
jgi:hypothetical protein